MNNKQRDEFNLQIRKILKQLYEILYKAFDFLYF